MSWNWNNERRFTFKTLSSGQARPYAPHIGVYRISVEWHPLRTSSGPEVWAMNEGFNKDKVRAVAKAFCGWDDEPITPFDTRLTSFLEVGPGLWEVRTRAEYTG